MGGYGQRMHDEILWILKNVFSLIIDTENFKDFKEQAINTWSNNKESVSTRNLLLHVLDSKNYESIAKQDEKNRIVDAFKSLIPADHSNDGVDPKLQIIREKLGMKNDESFYNSQYNIYWKNDLSTPAKKLEYKKALVLYGPPGTGKTYTSMEIAKTLIVKYYLSSGVVDNNVIAKCKKYINKTEDDVTFGNDEHISYLQFHINYNYEDFIAGQSIEVDSNGKSIVKTKKGFIFDIIKNAEKNLKAPYIVILDEINRTDISRVFGELFTAIEKRNTDVMLALRDPDAIGKRLCLNIPDNVYFIGTMNEIDFSLERVDFALRRRFVWEYCGYAKDVLRNIVKHKVPEIDDKKIEDFVISCTNLNRKIEEVLGESYHIGHAFFAEIANIYKQVNDSEEQDKWKHSKKVLWEISIKPTLDAYCGTMDSGLKEKYLGNKKDNGEFYTAFFGIKKTMAI
jgi:5-methylcytosine-specific restriction protein B